jgi:hypothetical protein
MGEGEMKSGCGRAVMEERLWKSGYGRAVVEEVLCGRSAGLMRD